MAAVTKRLRAVERGASGHWVGDGFPVRTLFAYPHDGAALSPFLLLDYAGPVEFPPTDERRGVGEHPHRGFETVTIVYAGEVEHRDSSGAGDRIGPGDVQWMTAARGIVHEEFHGAAYARRGGPFEMAQLWVNLPAKDKLSPPGYQAIVAGDVPTVRLPGGAGTLRVIAGELDGTRGPARTFTPMKVLDFHFEAAVPVELAVPEGWTALLAVRRGAVRVEAEAVESAEVAIFERRGATVRLEPVAGTTALLLAGEPIDEPIVGQGPFVMNTREEIHQAIDDYRSGAIGHLD